MHKASIVILLFIICFSCVSCEKEQNYIYNEAGNGDDIVYITINSNEYHKEDCKNIKSSNKAVKLS